jgi:protein SCO1/2
MNNRNSNKKFLKGLTVAFLLPLTFYIITKVLSKDKIHLPSFYGIEKINGPGDTSFHKVADIQLTNQLGDKVSLNKDLEGKILVIDLFFANCTSVCPKLSTNMELLQKAFKRTFKSQGGFDTSVRFISITTDPARDSFPALRKYADAYHANHDRWWFLTGDRNAIYNYAHNELSVLIKPDEGVESLEHSKKFVLLDQQRYIRGYYDGTDSTDIRRCADDIVLLTLEKKKKK